MYLIQADESICKNYVGEIFQKIVKDVHLLINCIIKNKVVFFQVYITLTCIFLFVKNLLYENGLCELYFRKSGHLCNYITILN